MIVGIQDGNSDGYFTWGLSVIDLEDYFKCFPGDRRYRPRFVAVIKDEDWQSWLDFTGENKTDYTGRNLGAWEVFWDNLMQTKPLSEESWQESKRLHGWPI